MNVYANNVNPAVKFCYFVYFDHTSYRDWR